MQPALKQKERKMKAITTKHVLFYAIVLLSVCWTIYIFHNSLQPSAVSSERSTQMIADIEKVIGDMTILSNSKQLLIRKSAHLFEFIVLGILLYSLQAQPLLRLSRGFLISILAGLLIACADETIQLFVPGREGKLMDVLIDFIGVIAGNFAARLVATHWKSLFGFLYKSEKNSFIH